MKILDLLKKIYSPKYRKHLRDIEIQAGIERAERMIELNLDPIKSVKKVDEKGW